MSPELTLAQARRNIKLVVLVNTLTKRSYLPLSAIYFVQISHLNIIDIGQMAAFFALIMLASDLPTGYLADRIGRARCIRIGAVLGVVAMLFYIFMQNKLGVFTGTFFEGVAYGFMSGAAGALVHDSLEVTQEEHNYSKVMSRSQAVSLLINAGLVVLVPLTYVIDPRLPFALGIVAFAGLLVTGALMREVRHHYPQPLRLPAIKIAMRKRTLFAFVLVLGVLGGIYSGPAELEKLALNDFGVQPEHLGWFFAGASLVGAALGPFIHRLKEVPLAVYATVDVMVAALGLMAAFSHSVAVFGIATMLTFGFWRYRRIIYQHHLLELYPTRYKATLYAIMNASDQVNQIWVPLVIAGLVAQMGMAAGLGVSGVATLVLLPVMLLVVVMMMRGHGRTTAS